MNVKDIFNKLTAWNKNPDCVSIKTDNQNFNEKAKKAIELLFSLHKCNEYEITLPAKIEETNPHTKYPCKIEKKDLFDFLENNWKEFPLFIECVDSDTYTLLLDHPSDIAIFVPKESIEEIRNSLL